MSKESKAEKHGTIRIASDKGKPITATEKEVNGEDKRLLDVNLAGIKEENFPGQLLSLMEDMVRELKILNQVTAHIADYEVLEPENGTDTLL